MLYTIGRLEVYEKYLNEDPNASKGIGGSVWKNREMLDTYLAKNPQPDFAIYGVEADWELDTTGGPEEVPWRNLTRNAKLVRLV